MRMKKTRIMKIAIGVVVVLVLLFLAVQGVLAQSSSRIEMYPYTVVQQFDDFEIREYEARNFSYVTIPKSSYNEHSSQGFRMLAGYIFGGNDQSQKIAMTSPVSVDMSTPDSTQVMFMIPAEYSMEDLPVPNDARVQFKTEPAKRVAAIRFGGWADDDRLAEYRAKLEGCLLREGIEHNGRFSYLGYNPPYQVIRRRNEVIVELVDLSK